MFLSLLLVHTAAQEYAQSSGGDFEGELGQRYTETRTEKRRDEVVPGLITVLVSHSTPLITFLDLT